MANGVSTSVSVFICHTSHAHFGPRLHFLNSSYPDHCVLLNNQVHNSFKVLCKLYSWVCNQREGSRGDQLSRLTLGLTRLELESSFCLWQPMWSETSPLTSLGLSIFIYKTHTAHSSSQGVAPGPWGWGLVAGHSIPRSYQGVFSNKTTV